MHYPKILFVTILFFAIDVSEAKAQTPVTVRYDTVVVHDTVRVHDTLNLADYLRSEEFEQLFYSSEYVGNLSLTDSMKEKLLRQTVTFWENRVLQDEQQTFSSMDSIKKYGLAGLIILGLNAMSPAQTDSTTVGKPHDPPKKHKTHLFNGQMNGFHLGYTIQYDLIEPILARDFGSDWFIYGKPLSGFHVGVECSYNFADYFGVSAALNFGTTAERFLRLSAPLKFEFHYPVSDKVMFTASTGVRLRVPARTFLEGFDQYDGTHNGSKWGTGIEPSPFIPRVGIFERNIFYADIMFDAGIYYRLRNEDYLRFTAGLNFATAKECVTSTSRPPIQDEPTETIHRNNHLYFQLAYIQSFDKHRKRMQAQPHWSTFDGMHHRHEVRFEVSDPFGLFIRMHLHKLDFGQAEYEVNPDDGLAFAFRTTPVFSFNYHYRLTKWFWVGAMVNYAYYKDHTDYPFHTDAVYTQRRMNCLTLMPELRFSYFNRPHVTLYSAVAAGTTLFLGKELYMGNFGEFRWEKSSKVTPSFQLTAFGVRAGGEHLFGSFELGIGIKGFASAGIGYAF